MQIKDFVEKGFIKDLGDGRPPVGIKGTAPVGRQRRSAVT